MKHVTNSDTLHAVLQVLVRLTRDYNLAKEAAKKGVVDLLLQVDQSVSFTGFIGLATIIIRHILEEPEALSSAMEKVCILFIQSFKTVVSFLQQNLI